MTFVFSHFCLLATVVVRTSLHSLRVNGVQTNVLKCCMYVFDRYHSPKTFLQFNTFCRTVDCASTTDWSKSMAFPCSASTILTRCIFFVRQCRRKADRMDTSASRYLDRKFKIPHRAACPTRVVAKFESASGTASLRRLMAV